MISDSEIYSSSLVIKQFTNINYVIYADELYWKVPTCSNNMPNKLILCARNVIKLLILNNHLLTLLKLNYLILPLNLLFVLLLIYSTLSRYSSINCNDVSNCAKAIYIYIYGLMVISYH